MKSKWQIGKLWAVFIIILVNLLVFFINRAPAAEIILWAPNNGDGTRAVSPGSGPGPYVLNASTLETYNFWATEGYHYQEVFIEIPISQLRAVIINRAYLILDSLGFFTPVPPGSARVYHLVPSGTTPSGNLATDQPHNWSSDGSWVLYDSSIPGSGDPGLKSIEVTEKIRADVNAGYAYSTFKIKCGSTDVQTNGTIYASETAGEKGPRLRVEYSTRTSSFPETAPLLLE